MKLTRPLSILTLMLLCGCALAPHFHSDPVFYVAPNGHDENPGTQARPFATLTRARDAVRQLNRSLGQDIKVVLRGGRYLMEQPLVLEPQDSGNETTRIIYEAYPGETPLLSGGRVISGFKPLGTAGAPAGLPAAARPHVLVAEIPQGWRFHYLYDNGEPRPCAATPEHDDWPRWPKIVGVGKRGPGGQELHFPAGALDHVPSNGDAELCWVPGYWWMNELAVLRKVNTTSATARRHSKNVTYAGKPGDGFRLQNVLPALDKPGEWVVDSAAGRVYYWPPSGSVEGREILAPALYNLVRFEGREDGPFVHHVLLRGLSFSHTDRLPEDQWPDAWLKRNFENPDAAIFLQNVEHCAVADCRIVNVGTYGIALNHHAILNDIVGCEIGHTGCGGIQLYGYGPGQKDVNKRNTISRNEIHHIGQAPYWHSAGVTISGSNRNRVTGNYIHDTPYCGVAIVGVYFWDMNRFTRCEPDAYGQVGAMYNIRWDELPQGSYDRYLEDKGTITWDEAKTYQHCGDNLVERNVLVNVMQKLHDGGALYSFSSTRGNVYRKNLVLNPQTGTMSWMLYMDNEADGATLEDNVCWSPGQFMSRGNNKWVRNQRFAERAPAMDALWSEIDKWVGARGGWPRPFDPFAEVKPAASTQETAATAPPRKGLAEKVPVPLNVWFDVTSFLEKAPSLTVDKEGCLLLTTDTEKLKVFSCARYGPAQLKGGRARYVEVEAAAIDQKRPQPMAVFFLLDDPKAMSVIGYARMENTGGLGQFRRFRANLVNVDGVWPIQMAFEGQGQVRVRRFRFVER